VGTNSVSDAARQVARIISDESAEAIVERCSRVLAETFDFQDVRGFIGPAPESAANVFFFDATKKSGLRVDSNAPLPCDAAAGIAALTEMIGVALESRAKTHLDDRFQRYLEPLGEAMVVWDLNEDRLVYANLAMVKLTGYSTHELYAGRPIWTKNSDDYLRRVSATRRLAFERGERRRYVDEVAVLAKDGATFWTEVHSYFRRDEITGHTVICAASHIIADGSTDSMEGQATLLEEVQELANIGAWTVDPYTFDGRWTAQLAKIHEAGPIKDMGDTLANFGPEALAALNASVQKVLATRETDSLELPITTPTGREKWLSVTTTAVVEHGEVIRLRGTAQDITWKKRAELELAQKQAQVQSLLDHLPDIISLRDFDNRILACNARLEQLKGVGPGDLIGKELTDDMRLDIHAPPSRPIRGERWLTFANDGHRELVETITAPIRDAAGKPVAILGIGRDITAARAAEEQLRAVQKMEAIGRLAGGVAHDFNNLLSVILSYTNLAMEALPSGHELQADLGEILAAGKRGEGLTKQLLAFSRRQLLHMAPLAIGDVVDSVGSMLKRVIGEDIELQLRRSDTGAFTKVDRGQIEQVIMNVAVNAREAMPDGGRLSITTAKVTLDDVRAMALDLPRGPYVELSVSDTGMGMDQATLRRVFEPFFTTKGRGKGTGLGLAMAYGIIRQSGGAIAIESVPGVGTTVRIFLPEYLAPAEAPAPRPLSAPKLRGHETVLVVEDEGPLRTVARRVLKGAGYDVLAAANAEEALRIAQEVGDRIDIVFTDVVMPGMNGGELVERLLSLYPRMKVVFTSGYTDEKLARSGVGDHRFLPKPYEPAQLTAIIRSVLDRLEALPS
jgi:two-component system cell cycle sensor histidine kinase/response regulator CckA